MDIISTHTIEKQWQVHYVRNALSEDANQIDEVHVASMKDWYQWIVDQSYLDSLQSKQSAIDRLKETIASNNEVFLVYEENWKVVWFIHWGKSRDQNTQYDNEIYSFYVNPSYQKKWIWTRLFTDFFEKSWNVPTYLRTLLWSKWESFYKKMWWIIDWEKEANIGGKTYKEIRYCRKK